MKIHSIFDSANKPQLRRSKEQNTLVLAKIRDFRVFPICLPRERPGSLPRAPGGTPGLRGRFPSTKTRNAYENQEKMRIPARALNWNDQEAGESRAAKSEKSQKILKIIKNSNFPKTISRMFLATLGMYTGPEMVLWGTRETSAAVRGWHAPRPAVCQRSRVPRMVSVACRRS